MHQEVLAVIAKFPQKGFSKTRLEATLGEEKTLEIYQAMLKDFFLETRPFCHKNNLKIFLFIEPYYESSLKYFQNLCPEAQIKAQRGNNFFEKLQNIFHDCEESFIHLTGTDIPDFPYHYLKTNKDLNCDQIYLGPDSDGGFYYLGASSQYFALLQIDTCQQETVYNQLLNNVRLNHLNYNELPVWSDIDYFEDLIKTLQRSHEKMRYLTSVCKKLKILF